MFVFDAPGNVFRDAIINGQARGIGEITAASGQGSGNVQVGAPDEKLGVNIKDLGTKKSQARTGQVTGLNHSVWAMKKQQPRLGLSAESVK